MNICVNYLSIYSDALKVLKRHDEMVKINTVDTVFEYVYLLKSSPGKKCQYYSIQLWSFVNVDMSLNRLKKPI